MAEGQEPEDEDQAWRDSTERIEQLLDDREDDGGEGPGADEDPGPSLQIEFDERHVEAFEGLAYIGHLQDTVTFAGHEFLVRTLTTGEKIEALQICAPMAADQMGYLKAYRSAHAAAALLMADGRPIPVAEKTVSVVSQRYRWITERWHDPVIDVIFEKWTRLEGRVLDLLVEMGAIGGEAQPTVQMQDS